MPQLNKGGKFVFGISRIREGGELFLPPQAMEEYGICREGRIYIFTGARATGGFCVTRKGLLAPTQRGQNMRENPKHDKNTFPEGEQTP